MQSEKERRYKTIEAITDGFWEWDMTKNELYISPKYKEFLGYTANELDNSFETLQNLIHADDRKKANTILDNALIGVCAYDVELRLRHKSGFYVWVHTKGAIFRDANNKVDFIICGANDITAKKETEIALEESKKTLKVERSLFVSGPVAMFKWSAEEGWPIIYVSPNVSDMLYTSADSLINKSSLFSELIHPSDIARVSNEVSFYIASQTKNFDQEYRLRKKDGEYGWFHDYTVVEYNENKEPGFINGYLINITDRKTAEEILRLREKQLSAIVDNLPVGVFFVSETEGIILSNKAGSNIWGELRKTKLEEFGEYKAWFADSGARLKINDWGAYKSLIHKENTINRKLKIETFDGKEKIILESSFTIQDDKDLVSGAIVIHEDITDREAYEVGLKEAKEQAESANKLKSEFLANMSHEIRTPMNAVLGFAELLKNEPLDAKSKNFVDGIIISGRNLLGLINDILDLSKIEAGKMTIMLEPTDLKKVLRELKIIFNMKAKDKGILFNVNMQDIFPNILLLDEIRVKQILFNLLGNAIKFTETGGVTLTASVSESSINPKLIDVNIKVEDTGIGIPKEQIEAIFEAFKQADGQSARKYGGTGLGLTISKKLSDLMGAHLEVTSEVGCGSVFTLTIDGVERAMSDFEESKSEDDESTMFIGVALLVENIAANMAIIKDFLTSRGMQIIEVENGKIGVETAMEYMPDLIIIDIQTPIGDEHKVAKILKNNPNTRHIPVLAVTASATKEQKESLKAVYDGYLQKPIDFKALASELSKFLPCVASAKSCDNLTKTINISPSEREEISRLLKREWLRVNILKSNDEIEEFAKLAKKTANEICSQYLNEYADLLIEASEGFKIAQINKLFEQFEAIIKEPY